MSDKRETLKKFNLFTGTFLGMSLDNLVTSFINVKELTDKKLKDLLKEEECEMPSTRMNTRKMILLQEAMNRGIPIEETINTERN